MQFQRKYHKTPLFVFSKRGPLYIFRKCQKNQKRLPKSVENIHREYPYLFSEKVTISAKIYHKKIFKKSENKICWKYSQGGPLPIFRIFCKFRENIPRPPPLYFQWKWKYFSWNHFEMFTVAIENICEVLHMRKTRGHKLTADVPKISV